MSTTTQHTVSDRDRQLIREAVLIDASGLGDLAIAIDNGDSEGAQRIGRRAVGAVAVLAAIGFVQSDGTGPVSDTATEYAVETADAIDAMLAEGEGDPVRDAERAVALRRFVEAVA